MNIFHSLILGAVEGVTEFLPISSTGHLILTSHLLRLSENDVLKTFEISIQFAAILAVAALYWKILSGNFAIIKKIIVGFIPTGILGLLLHSLVKKYLLGSEIVVLWSLFLGGVAILMFERWYAENKAAEGVMVGQISYQQAALVGLFQSIAMIPGVSRSAATILGGLLLGLPRKTAVEFSFLLAVPTMAAATGLDLLKTYSEFTTSDIPLFFAGGLMAFGTALVSVRWLISYVQKKDFTVFGWYRIGIAILLAATLLW